MCQRWASGAVCYRGIVRAASSLMGGEAQRRSIAARADSALAKYRQRTALSVRLSSASANGICTVLGMCPSHDAQQDIPPSPQAEQRPHPIPPVRRPQQEIMCLLSRACSGLARPAAETSEPDEPGANDCETRLHDEHRSTYTPPVCVGPELSTVGA